MTNTSSENGVHDSGIDARRARADSYFNDYMKGQQAWYSSKASLNKNISQSLGVIILASGGLVGFLQIFGVGPELGMGSGVHLIGVLTALLGLIDVIAKGLERIGNFDETWSSYRQTSELMKQEYRLYLNGAGDYGNIRNEESTYLRFVENVEEIVSREQNLFWRTRSNDPADTDDGNGTNDGG